MRNGGVPYCFQQSVCYSSPSGASASEKFCISNNKVRIEPQGQNNIVIIDNATQMMDVLIPAQHMYIEMKISQAGPQANQLGLLAFHTNDVGNACDDLQKIRSKPGACHKIGDESVSGRSAVR